MRSDLTLDMFFISQIMILNVHLQCINYELGVVTMVPLFNRLTVTKLTLTNDRFYAFV